MVFTGCSPSNQSWSYFGMITKGHHSQLQNVAYQNQYSLFGHSEFLMRSYSKSSVTIAQEWMNYYPFFYHYLVLVYYLITILFTTTAISHHLVPLNCTTYLALIYWHAFVWLKIHIISVVTVSYKCLDFWLLKSTLVCHVSSGVVWYI